MTTLDRYFHARTQNAISKNHYEGHLSTASDEELGPAELFVKISFGGLHAVYWDPEDPSKRTPKPIFIHDQYGGGRRTRGDPDAYLGLLSRQFFQKYYALPKLHRGRDTDGTKVSLERFIDDAFSRGHDHHRNSLSVVLGDMGAGKTTFVNYLISEKLRALVDDGQLWFLRLDVDHNLKNELGSEGKIVTELCNKAHNVLMRLSEKFPHFKKHSKLINELSDSTQGALTRMSVLVSIIRAVENAEGDMQGPRFVLIIDNLDSLVHKYDRILYYNFKANQSATRTTTFEETQNQIEKFIESFSGVGIFRSLACNVLLVMRRDSYGLLMQFPEFSSSGGAVDEDRNVYNLATPNWEEAYLNRFRLIKEFDSGWRDTGIKLKVGSIVETIFNNLKAVTPDGLNFGQQLERLTNGSLRDFMRFIETFGSLPLGGLVQNALKQEPAPKHCSLGLLAYMLNSRRLYSQLGSNFPNIYLARVMSESTNPGGVVHSFSYWLKRLLVEYVRSRGFVDSNSVIEYFCNNRHGNGYPENLVRECLGSLTDARQSNLLNAERVKNNGPHFGISTRDIALTRRAEYCLDSIFDHYCYLQLIVNDNRLAMPKCLAKDFPDPETHAYSFIVRDTNNYLTSTIDLHKRRIRQVTLFLYVLEASFEVEREMYSSAFEELANTPNFEFPSLRLLQNNVRKEIEQLGQVFAELKVKEILESVEGHRSIVIEGTKKAMSQMHEDIIRRGQPGVGAAVRADFLADDR